MSGPPDTPAGDDEAHLAALLAVLALARADGDQHGTPLQRWRTRRLAALTSSTSASDRPSAHR